MRRWYGCFTIFSLCMQECTFEDLSPLQQELVLRAEAVRENGYCIASHFYVGAAVRTAKGNVYVGANVENVSYGLTICAEPSALVAANAASDRQVTHLAVIARAEHAGTEKPTTPCGRCRQFIYEFAQISQVDIEVICANTAKDRILVTTIGELLPLGFGPQDLGFDVSVFR